MEFISFLLVAAVIALYVYFICGIYKLASRYGRSAGAHTFLAVVITPILPIIYLLCAGETDEHRKARIQEEEKWRAEVSKDE